MKTLFYQTRSLFVDIMKIDFSQPIADERWHKLNFTNEEHVIRIDDFNSFI